MGTERDFGWGNGPMRQCAHEVLLGCARETFMVFLTSVTPIDSIK